MTRLLLSLAAAALLAAAPASGAVIDPRTLPASVGPYGGVDTSGSTTPSLSAGGRVVAFAAGGGIVWRDLRAGTSTSLTPGADGPSSAPALAPDASVVAFASVATNLVPGDANGVQDVFLARPGRPPASVTAAADGPSGEPDVSVDGRRVVFTSTATNLDRGDANAGADVYVLDRTTGTTRLVSRTRSGGAGNGPSGGPAVSPDGRYVSFWSAADDLVPRDTNRATDVFVADTRTGRVRRVSVSTRGRQQGRAVAAPFTPVSDISTGGRYVVFDSDARNLVRGDRNDDTDVFLRDRRRGRTTRVSLTDRGGEADNDSFAPSLSPDGRFVAFESFAGNLAPRDADGEDVFLRDRRRAATTLVSVGAENAPRGPEAVEQLLQRPAVSGNGTVVAFTSTAALAAGDGNGVEDVYLRLTAAPRPRIAVRRGRLRLAADDPVATRFRCTLRRAGRERPCRDGQRLRRAARVTVRVAGIGTLLSRPRSRRVR